MIFRMSSRILILAFAVIATAPMGRLFAQSPQKTEAKNPGQKKAAQSQLYTDPATGIVYRKVVRTIEKPVYETKYLSLIHI